MKKTLFVIILLMVVVSGSAQEKQFRRACKKNTQETYTQFIQKYPESSYTEEALYRRALLINTPAAYEAFISKYPDGSFTARIIDTLCLKRYNDIANSHNENQLKEFLALPYACEPYKGKIMERLIVVGFNNAKEKNTVEAYEAFIGEYPNSAYNREVKGYIATLEVAKVIESNSLAAANALLLKYPNNIALNGFIKKKYDEKDKLLFSFNTQDLTVGVGFYINKETGQQVYELLDIKCSGTYVQSINDRQVYGKIIKVEEITYPDSSSQYAFVIEGSFFVQCNKHDLITYKTKMLTNYTINEELMLNGEKFQLAVGKGVMLINPYSLLPVQSVISETKSYFRGAGFVSIGPREHKTQCALTPYHVAKENSRKDDDFNYIVLPAN
jgi:hypothetical protein